MTKLMVITAHPADLVERSGGAIAKHIAKGDEAMFVTLTSGAVTHAFGLFPATGEDKLKDMAKIKAMKKKELEEACKILGVQHMRFLDFPENPSLFGYEHYKEIITLMREFRPEIVLCPHPVEFGRHDHMDAGRFTVACVDYVRADGFDSPLAPHSVKQVYMFYYPDGRADKLMAAPRMAPDVVVDISDVWEKKRDAMAQFGTTQTKPGEDYKAKLTRFMDRVDGGFGYLNGVGYAEQYVRLNPWKFQYLPE